MARSSKAKASITHGNKEVSAVSRNSFAGRELSGECALDESLGLRMISIRLRRALIAGLKKL
jgi:hypothetical protein